MFWLRCGSLEVWLPAAAQHASSEPSEPKARRPALARPPTQKQNKHTAAASAAAPGRMRSAFERQAPRTVVLVDVELPRQRCQQLSMVDRDGFVPAGSGSGTPSSARRRSPDQPAIASARCCALWRLMRMVIARLPMLSMHEGAHRVVSTCAAPAEHPVSANTQARCLSMVPNRYAVCLALRRRRVCCHVPPCASPWPSSISRSVRSCPMPRVSAG